MIEGRQMASIVDKLQPETRILRESICFAADVRSAIHRGLVMKVKALAV